MTTSFSDGPAARWSHSPRRPAEAISAPAEWIGRPLRSVAVRARKVDEVGRAAGWGKGRKLALTAISLLLGTGQGTGSELRQPLGYTMVGGLLVSQILTLFTTPVVYLYLDRVSDWLGRHGPGNKHDREYAGAG
jgi:hypothetical protein